MSSEPQPPEAGTAWPVMTDLERRVLGVMVEKAKTTPDVYPMSINALVTGCNQKSNRDPILNLSEPDVEDTLATLQKKGLAIKITGGRVTRWRHTLYDTWRLSKVELAILGELLVRGPQTEGELRGRASRMEDIADLDTLRDLLRPLAERRLVVYLSPEGRRGTLLTHGFHPPEELEYLRRVHKAGAVDAPPTQAVRVAEPVRATLPPDLFASMATQLAQAKAEIGDLRNHVTELQHRLVELTEQVRILREDREGGQASAPAS